MPKLIETISTGSKAEAFDLHPNKNEIAYATQNTQDRSCTLQLYNFETKKSTQIFEEKSATLDALIVHSLFYDASGSRIFVQMNEKTFVYNTQTQERTEVADFSAHPSYFNPHLIRNCMSSDRKRLLCCHSDGIKVINTEDFRTVVEAPYSAPLRYRHAAMSKSGSWLAMYLEGPDKGDIAMQIWDIDAGRAECEWKIETHDDADERIAKELQRITFSPDDTQLYLSGGFGEGPIVVDLKTGKFLYGFPDPIKKRKYMTCFSMTFSHNGKVLVIGEYMGYLGIADPATNKLTEEVETENKRTYYAVFSDDDTLLLTGGDGDKICIYQM